MKLVEVTNHKIEKEFIKLPYKIYKDDENWIAPLEKNIREIFTKGKNVTLNHGEAIRWILLNKNGEVVGRIAAFINHKAVSSMEFPIGGIGFFECINDKKAAFRLFDRAKEWLELKGMKGMDGPINFGERDRYWGLLVEGFSPPSFMENYNPAYYKDFFEEYGFRVYFKQTTYLLLTSRYNAERFGKIAERVLSKPGYRTEHLDLKKLDKYAEDFAYVYNTAWKKFENFKPVTKNEVLANFRQMKSIILPQYVWFSYVNNEPAGLMVMIPEINQLLKYVNGKLNLWGLLKFAFYKIFRPMNRLKGVVFGFLPQYQNLGLDAAIVHKFSIEVLKVNQYKEICISWIGDFNPKMGQMMKAFEGEVLKVHYTYRKLFDESLPFTPYKIEENE